ncbi:glutathione peroxidase [candidate division KSB1 bacterium]|nr:glutathione peroxidase [candidate division KSB1 bacterium]
MLSALFGKDVKGKSDAAGPLDFIMTSIDGQSIDLSRYAGQVILMVNVASKCGLTPQYEGLQHLYEKYKDQGFVILAFPANNFLGQEPGTNEEIQTFCSVNYGVTFPMFAKISVKGKDQHPLYHYLTDGKSHEFGGAIQWNFEKFLIGKDGVIKARFSPKTKPQDEAVIAAIENELQS